MEITIHSVIDNLDDTGLASGEPEINITTLPVKVAEADDRVLFSYCEEQEGVKITTDITAYSDGRVILDRQGGVVWRAVFQNGGEDQSVYKIPPYSFDCTVKTKRAEYIKESGGFKIRLLYSMVLGGGEKEVKMRITVI